MEPHDILSRLGIQTFHEPVNEILVHIYSASIKGSCEPYIHTWADPEGCTAGPDLPPPEKSQKYRVSKQYWLGSPEKHKAAKPAFSVWPSSAR